MNIVTHCVSQYELFLNIDEWRIVLLFRNVSDINVKAVESYYKLMNKTKSK